MKVTYHINADDIITLVNRAWDYFADSNAAPELLSGEVRGQSLWGLIRNEGVQKLYQQLFSAVRTNRNEVTFDFRCDSPEVKRFMTMYVSPLVGASLSIECTLVAEEQLPVPFHFVEREVQAPKTLKRCSVCNAIFVDDAWTDVLSVCSQGDVFDFSKPINVAHVVCPSCVERIGNKIRQITRIDNTG